MNTVAIRTDFAARLFDRLAASQVDKNLFLSPFSIQVALAMVAAGAKAETRRVLADLIGAPESVADQNRQYADWIKAVHGEKDCGLQLATANALWAQNGYRVKLEYKQAVADCYGGAFHEVDFVSFPEQAVQTINDWTARQTGEMIKNLITRNLVTDATRLILTNAIYFKGQWERAFEKSETLDEDWHGLNGARKVPMMQQRRGFLYCESDDYQALDLPYQGQQLSLLIVLPRKNDGLHLLENSWAAAGSYRQVTDALRHEKKVIVSLPRFKMETQFKLSSVLGEMGAQLAFGARADFSGIAEEPLKISEVIHKAFIDVNEEGTEAAAATGVIMAKSMSMASLPRIFLADHPFLFFIRHRSTNSVLFSGRLLDPN
jgi:serpin B